MGVYLNPGNNGFRTIRNGIYVDKTGLIEYINNTIDTPWKMTCFSRPRRFGKSFAAKMLCAYYDKSCDSDELFSDLLIADTASYNVYRNQFNVLYLDITRFISLTSDIKNLINEMQKQVIEELRAAYPNIIADSDVHLADAMLAISHSTGEKFFVIIDEWDALFREAVKEDALQREYIMLLRGLFKAGPATDDCIAGAYMTGILPIKKYGTQSALTDFREFTMVRPAKLAEYVGFTEQDVKKLCKDNQMDYDFMQRWYDGYSFHRVSHVYSPNSVMNAIMNEEYSNYWTTSETYESLKQYISMNFDGLKDAVTEILGGKHIPVMSGRFQNDMSQISGKDDVLTLLVHLGYLAYDEEKEEVYLPNLEVADAFKNAIEGEHWEKIANAITDSQQLLEATIHGDSVAVEHALDMVHSANTSILRYNDENSLSCAIMIAYYTARKDYEIIREFPTGKGFADIVFIPYRNVDKPAMIVELKYDESEDAAIRQIKERRYTGALQEYKGNMILVGINYRKDDPNKKHSCVIEKYEV